MAPRVRVQVVLFETPAPTCARLLDGLGASVAHALGRGLAASVTVAIGDCSSPGVDERTGAALAGTSPLSIEWVPFGQNLGHGAAQNRLAEGATEDVLVFLNPDAYPAPGALSALLGVVAEPGVGIAEARQVPVEIPKVVEAITGDTPWCSGCFAAVGLPLFARVGGFDEAFFLHGDDVDLSWRIRAEGLRSVYVASAVVFHDRWIEPTGYASSNDVAAQHMYLADLLLAWKAERLDQVEDLLETAGRGAPWEQAAAAQFRSLRGEGRLPAPYGFDAREALASYRLRRF
ncbi:MAG: glycosyltransferase [Acidimicrobiales bacterium]